MQLAPILHLTVRPYFIDQLKILLGSNSISSFLLSKKIRTQKCWFLSPWHHFFSKNIRQKRGEKNSIFTTFWNSFWQLLQKMMLRAQKITFLSWFFLLSRKFDILWLPKKTWGHFLKYERAVTVVSHVKILISMQIIKWLILQKKWCCGHKNQLFWVLIFLLSHTWGMVSSQHCLW